MEEYVESIQTCFEEAGEPIPSSEMCEDIVECVRAIDEWASYSTPSAKDFESNEISKLKQRIKELEEEKKKGWDAFRQNVAKRNNCDISSVSVEEDGSAFIKY